MAYQPVPDTVGVEIRGTLLGQQVENTLYYKYVSPPDEAELADLAEVVADTFIAEWLPLLPAGWIGREVYVRDLSAPITVQATDISILGLAGGQGGETAPSYVTIAVARRSGLTGRSARGRIFWMGLSEVQLQGNLVFAGGDIVDAVEAMDAAVTTAGYAPVIVSRKQNNVVLANAITYPLTQWLLVDLDLDTRRSRKAGSGS